jgi:hypothetical protein
MSCSIRSQSMILTRKTTELVIVYVVVHCRLYVATSKNVVIVYLGDC